MQMPPSNIPWSVEENRILLQVYRDEQRRAYPEEFPQWQPVAVAYREQTVHALQVRVLMNRLEYNRTLWRLWRAFRRAGEFLDEPIPWDPVSGVVQADAAWWEQMLEVRWSFF